jgi:hypothetical protein
MVLPDNREKEIIENLTEAVRFLLEKGDFCNIGPMTFEGWETPERQAELARLRMFLAQAESWLEEHDE